MDLQNYVLTLNVTASNSYGSAIIGNGGSLVKNGASVLSINENNTFTGGTTLNAGSFRLQASGNRATNGDGSVSLASSPFGTGALTIVGGKIFSSSTAGRTIYNSINIAGSFISGDTSTNQLGDITVSTNVTGALTTVSADASITVDAPLDWYQPISGAGKSLTKLGLANLHLRGPGTLGTLEAGAGNLYVRNTNEISTVIVRGGAVLGYGSSNALTPGYFGNAVLVLSNGATFGQFTACGTGTEQERTIPNNLQIQGDVTFGLGTYGNYFGGNVDLTGSTRTVTISNSTALSGGVSNGGLIVNNTSATRTLSLNGNNTYTNGTTLNGGIISLGHDSGLGAGRLTVNSNLPYTNVTVTTNSEVITNVVGDVTNLVTNTTVATNTNVLIASNTLTVSTNRTVANAINLAPGAAFNMDTASNNWTQNGAISGGGSIVKQGAGTLTLLGALTYSGTTTVQDGTLRIQRSAFTADITTNSISIAFSSTPSAGTNQVLPGALVGTYPAATITGLGAGQSGNYDATTGQLVVTQAPVKTDQTITFNLLPSKTYGDSAFTINATASSGLPVSFSSSDQLVATVSGSTITIVGAGTTTITASQAGDSTYNAAPNVTQNLVVAKANQTITFGSLASKLVGDASFSLSATASSGLTVSYISGNTAVATISGNTVTVVGAGSTVITASQAGNSNYNPASNVTQTLVVTAPAGISNWLGGEATNAANVGKYLIGGATNVSAASEWPVVINTNSTNLILSAIIRTNDSKGDVKGQWVTSLSGFSGLASGSNEVTGARAAVQGTVPEGCERQEFAVPRTNGTNRLFLRLKATLQP